jgi:hypothetical protein
MIYYASARGNDAQGLSGERRGFELGSELLGKPPSCEHGLLVRHDAGKLAVKIDLDAAKA